MAAEAADEPVIRLGPLPVATDGGSIRDFRAAVGMEPTLAEIPLVFPIRWLTHPEIRASLLALAGKSDLVPLHEAQSFACLRPLDPESDYFLFAELKRLTNPLRLAVEARVATRDGEVCVRLETMLRLIRLSPGTSADH